MIGQFAVNRAVDISERSLFALVGEITEGRATTGMQALLEADEDAFDARVHDVKYLDDDDGSGSELALTFSYSGPEKLERWRAIDWPGKSLSLYWGG